MKTNRRIKKRYSKDKRLQMSIVLNNLTKKEVSR